MESAGVGLILASSVIIAGERRGHTVRQILEQFRSDYGEAEIGLSVVTIVELIHGVLLIGATALQLGFGVVTGNTRHFEQIPGLNVVKR